LCCTGGVREDERDREMVLKEFPGRFRTRDQFFLAFLSQNPNVGVLSLHHGCVNLAFGRFDFFIKRE